MSNAKVVLAKIKDMAKTYKASAGQSARKDQVALLMNPVTWEEIVSLTKMYTTGDYDSDQSEEIENLGLDQINTGLKTIWDLSVIFGADVPLDRVFFTLPEQHRFLDPDLKGKVSAQPQPIVASVNPFDKADKAVIEASGPTDFKKAKWSKFFTLAKNLVSGNLELPQKYTKNPSPVFEELEEAELEDSNVITSKLKGELNLHQVILDLDLDAVLVPSSTPGHHHLILKYFMPWKKYQEFLKDMAKYGIIEPGYADASIEKGAAVLRTPWTNKNGQDTTEVGVPMPAPIKVSGGGAGGGGITPGTIGGVKVISDMMSNIPITWTMTGNSVNVAQNWPTEDEVKKLWGQYVGEGFLKNVTGLDAPAQLKYYYDNLHFDSDKAKIKGLHEKYFGPLPGASTAPTNPPYGPTMAELKEIWPFGAESILKKEWLGEKFKGAYEQYSHTWVEPTKQKATKLYNKYWMVAEDVFDEVEMLKEKLVAQKIAEEAEKFLTWPAPNLPPTVLDDATYTVVSNGTWQVDAGPAPVAWIKNQSIDDVQPIAKKKAPPKKKTAKKKDQE